MKTINELVVGLAQTQQEIVKTATNGNPIIATLPMQAATHGYKNVYAKQTKVDAPKPVQRDSELPVVGISHELGEATLGKIGGRLPMPRDLATNLGGYEVMLDRNLQTIIEKGTNNNEKQIYYDGFMKYALQNGNYASAGGTTDNKQYSLVIAHYDPAGVVGLYNGNKLSNGKLFEQYMLWGGAEGEIELADGTKCTGKMFCIEAELGIQLARPEYVQAIVNIEPKANASDSKKIDGLPSLELLAKKLSDARANMANTFIYCHPYIASCLAINYNLDQRRIKNGDGKLDFILTEINGIPVVGSYNINDGTESVIA